MLIVFMLVPMVYGITFTEGVYFQAEGGGLITFEEGYTADQARVTQNGLWGFFWNTRKYSSLAFNVSANANLTITKIDADTIEVTVNAPTDTTSITEIYVGLHGLPTDVTGGSSWSYNKNTKIVSIEAEHHSPAYIALIFKTFTQVLTEEFQVSAIGNLTFLFYMPLLMAFGVIYGSLTGAVDIELALTTIGLLIGLSLLILFAGTIVIRVPT